MNLIKKFKNWCDKLIKERRVSQLEKLVIEEATNLREFALPEEKSALFFNRLNPTRVDECIYGQMIGDCDSRRAIELITKSCPRVYNKDAHRNLALDLNVLNGNPKGKPRDYYWSPIEIFIYENRNGSSVQNNKALIEYIKGESDTLKFI